MFELIFKGPLLVTILCTVIFFILLIQYRNLLKFKITSYANVPFLLRLIVLSLLIYLLLEPLLRYEKQNKTAFEKELKLFYQDLKF